MNRLLASALAIPVAGIALAACSSGSSTTPTTSAGSTKFSASSECQAYVKANPSAQVTTTADYVMVAGMGASEAMYTPEHAASTHPKSGEIMVSGQMGDGGNSMSMGAGSSMAHLEVHVCSRATGKAVTDMMPSMTIHSSGSGAMATSVAVAEMQGLDRNPADTHYGNNVTITPGDQYKVVVTMNGQTAGLTLTAPMMSK
jgi:hypothetical protein